MKIAAPPDRATEGSGPSAVPVAGAQQARADHGILVGVREGSNQATRQTLTHQNP